MLLREVKTIFHKELDEIYGKEEVNSFFYLLIEQQLQLERFVLALRPDLNISKEEESPLFLALSRLKLSEPIQYILGKMHFMELEFLVNKNVLIPRPETEELVRWIIEEKRNTNPLKILDIGTGSGCIAISLAKNFPDAKVYAIDNSQAALDLAKKNAALNDVNIVFLHRDIFKFEPAFEIDLIVSNPPYVRESEKREMHTNVLKNEPNEALFVTDDDPLKFYKTITEFATRYLTDRGTLYFEINQYLGKETQQLLQDHNFLEIELRKDMFGNDRMLKGKQ